LIFSDERPAGVRRHPLAGDGPHGSGTVVDVVVEGTTAAMSALLATMLFLIRVAPSALLAVIILAWPATVAWRRLRAAPEA